VKIFVCFRPNMTSKHHGKPHTKLDLSGTHVEIQAMLP